MQYPCFFTGTGIWYKLCCKYRNVFDWVVLKIKIKSLPYFENMEGLYKFRYYLIYNFSSITSNTHNIYPMYWQSYRQAL
jgi:hypothetical protein